MNIIRNVSAGYCQTRLRDIPSRVCRSLHKVVFNGVGFGESGKGPFHLSVRSAVVADGGFSIRIDVNGLVEANGSLNTFPKGFKPQNWSLP